MASLGRADLTPKTPVGVGGFASWTLNITVGDYGFDRVSEIAVVRATSCDMEVPQFTDPQASGYTTVETDGHAELHLRFDTRLHRAPWRAGIAIRLGAGMLLPGQRIILRMGDRRQGSPGLRAQTFPQTRHRFRVLADYFGTGDFREIAQDTDVGVIPGPPVRADLVAPSVVTVGRPFVLRARVLDRWGNPTPSFSGDLALAPEAGMHIQPIEPDDWRSGTAVIAQVTLTAPGTFYLRASGDFDARSNPVVAVADDSRHLPLFWSDMHWQTDSTVGIGSVRECLSYARDAALIDVAAWQGNDFQITPQGWDEMRREVARFNEPGRFVVFPGYEHSALRPTGGDHNVLFLSDDAEFFPSSRWQNEDLIDVAKERTSTRQLCREFRNRRDVMLIPHVGGRASHLDYFDATCMPVIEIFSHHGNFEWFAKDALSRGLIVGFVATSDDHTGRPGLTSPTGVFAAWNQSLDLQGGHTGVYAQELTREAIWDALRARHCFATTGARIVLDVRMNGHMMGDIVQGTRGTLAASIHGTAPLLETQILRGARIVYEHVLATPGENENPRILVYWRGPIVGPSAGKTCWSGTLTIAGGKILNFAELGFTTLGDGVRRCSDETLEITSTTSGNFNGLAIEMERPNDHELVFETEAVAFRAPLSQVDARRKVFSNLQQSVEVVVRKASNTPAPRSVTLTYADDIAEAGVNPYWLRVVQADGHEAWSSPIYLNAP